MQGRLSARDGRSSIRAIVFDFGGVLVDWNPRYLYRKLFADEEAMERFFREIDFIAWNHEQDRGRPFAEGVALLSREFPHYAELIAAYRHRWEESISGPIWETVEILGELKRQGYPLYGLTNWSAETFPLVRDRYEFFGWFDAIVVSGEVRMCKPEPGIFEVLLERSGRAAGECLFIDDSPANVAASEQLGFQAIRFESPAQLRDELVRRGLLA
jgi:2-haloacid dehalogenase